jgi:hypothetical protein
MTGYARGGLVMIWEIDTGKPWMKVIATPEKSVGDTQADRVRQAQDKAKQAARLAAEAKKRMRAKSNPSMARSGSDAFLPSQPTDGMISTRIARLRHGCNDWCAVHSSVKR